MDWSPLVWPLGVRTYWGFWTAAGFWAALILSLWLVVLVLLRASFREGKIYGQRRSTWALKVTMLCHHVVVSILSFAAIMDDPLLMQVITRAGSTEVSKAMIRDLDAGPSKAAEFLVPITCGYMIADLLLLPQWNLSGKAGWTEAMLMIVHHAGSLAGWPVAVIWDFCARYVIFLLFYEISGIFLTLNWMLTTAGMKASRWYLISGGIFTFSFMLVRVLGALPQLVAFWQVPPWQNWMAPVPQWALPWSRILLIPHALNFFWGYKVLVGFLAVISKSSAGRTK